MQIPQMLASSRVLTSPRYRELTSIPVTHLSIVMQPYRAANSRQLALPSQLATKPPKAVRDCFQWLTDTTLVVFHMHTRSGLCVGAFHAGMPLHAVLSCVAL